MATSIIKNNVVESITPTYSGSSFVDGTITKTGKTVCVGIRIKSLSTISENTTNDLITGLPKPKGMYTFPILLQGGSSQFGWIGTNGTIAMYSYARITTNNILVLSFSYQVA